MNFGVARAEEPQCRMQNSRGKPRVNDDIRDVPSTALNLEQEAATRHTPCQFQVSGVAIEDVADANTSFNIVDSVLGERFFCIPITQGL